MNELFGQPFTTIEDAMQQWGHINEQKQRKKLIDMQMEENQRANERQQSLRDIYAQGQTPTPEQFGAVDPQMGMQAQQAHQLAVQKNFTMLQDIATQVKNKTLQIAQKSGAQEGTPQFQQIFQSVTDAYKPVMSSISGLQPNQGPADWNSLNALASANPGQQFHAPMQSTAGNFGFNDQTGQWEPIIDPNTGKRLMAANSDPYNAAQMMAAKEAEKGVKVEGPEGSTSYMPQKHANPAFNGSNQFPGLQTLQPNEVPQEMIKSPSLAQQNQAKLDYNVQKNVQESQAKRGQVFKNIENYLTKEVNGKSIDSLIDESTGSLAGEVRDKLGNVVGMSSKGSLAAAQLKTISGWLAGNVPRFEGPQSDQDRKYYLQMAGQIGDTSIPSAQRKKSFEALKAMISNNEAQPKSSSIEFMGFE